MLNPATCDKVAMRKTIAATVVAIDEAVGVVEQALKDAGMWDNTLIVFSTDNGGPTDGTNNNMMNNFPLRSGKGETFEGGIRAVGFMHGAGLSPGVVGKTSSVLHHVSDDRAVGDAGASDGRAIPGETQVRGGPGPDRAAG